MRRRVQPGRQSDLAALGDARVVERAFALREVEASYVARTRGDVHGAAPARHDGIAFGGELHVLGEVEGRRERVVEQYTDKFTNFRQGDRNLLNLEYCSIYSPVDGVVTGVRYHAGGFFNAAIDKASVENERNALKIRMNDGAELTCVQIAGLVARRILCYVKQGDRLHKGQRFGFIRFGSRVDLYLAPTSRPRVAVGDKVYAGETVLAEIETESSER